MGDEEKRVGSWEWAEGGRQQANKVKRQKKQVKGDERTGEGNGEESRRQKSAIPGVNQIGTIGRKLAKFTH